MAVLNTQHKVAYFSSLKRFYQDRRGLATKLNAGQDVLPEGVTTFLANTLDNLHTLFTSGKDSSCPPYALNHTSPVVLFSDLDVEEAAYASEFIHILDIYEYQTQKIDTLIKPLIPYKDDWNVISLSSPEGAPIITNYVCQTVDLAALLILLSHYSNPSVSEILAYRTAKLYNALILACSKPF